MIGRNIGAWKLTARLGSGGMGEVYLAEHGGIGRKAAVKVLHPQYAVQPHVVERFFNEARAANRVKHPGIIEIWDYGQTPELGAYFIMEFLDGESLQQRMKRTGRLTAKEVTSICSRVASAVGAAHKAGVVHRDLKPDNVFILPDPDHPSGERVKVLDFGIAKLQADGGTGGGQTRTGSVMGTPIYMSPEQCHGAKNVDWRTDIYALGVIAYEALTGRPPFMAQGFGELLSLHLTQAPRTLREIDPTLPADLEAVVMRALAKDPDERWQSMEHLVAALQDPAKAVAGGLALATPSGKGRADGLAPGAVLSAVTPGPGGGTRPGSTEVFESQPTFHRSTLTSSAAELAPPRRGSRLIAVLGAAGVVLLVGGGATLYALGGSTDEADGTSDDRTVVAAGAEDERPAGDREDEDEKKAARDGEKTGARRDELTAATGESKTAAVERDESAAKAGDAPTAKALPVPTVRAAIVSTPPGARVVRAADGVEVGVTPWSEVAPIGTGTRPFDVILDGYETVRIDLNAAADERKAVKLALAGKSGKKPKTKTAPATTGSAPASAAATTRTTTTPKTAATLELPE